ncbi:MAG: DEAD/DEAH box helicase [Treponema sp.]|jgi:ATP-dependent RNA helicase RhlB|nr:DEAD/DEAH box helicase [Treponema sp.]
MRFNEFNLHPDLQKGIDEAGYVDCMPVQEQVLAHAFGGQDLYVQSQTGTGKTAAFLVVIFQRLLTEDFLVGKKALIMAPTRELAVQIEEEANMLGKYLPVKTGSFYGGVGYTQQEKLLRDNVQIMVGTPGRVLDLNKSGRMNLMEIAFLVLDEADRMFDMGFYPDLRKLIKVVPPADRRQTLLFSATLNSWVKNLAWEYTKKPFEIEIKPEIVTVEEVDQILYHVPSEEKMKLLLGILKREQPESAIIFCNTKRYTEIIAKRLRMNGYTCEFIVGDLPQSRRLKVIDDVKAGKIKFLVATDVAARGLDIEGLAMVVNYDLPNEAENYVHRIGRTARAGKTGRAITLVSEQDVYELPAIERYIGKKLPSEIASEELHAEDASAGQQIRTELYEDRREERHVHGKGARPHTQGKGGRRGEGRHGGKAHDDHESRGGKAPNDYDSRKKPGKPPAKEKHLGRKPPLQHEPQELSHLSFEERMALYKQKYSKGEKPAPQKHPKPPLPKKPHSQKHPGAQKPPRPAKQEPTHAPAEQKPEQKPEKKGILARLLGKLKKK